MDHNWAAASRGGMSLDGGYTGSIDHAIANLHVGRNQGRKEGMADGYDQGFVEGQSYGYAQGWDAGIARGNLEMSKQLTFTRQHIEEKERLRVSAQQQQELIDQLEEKVRLLSEENALLRAQVASPGIKTDLNDLVTTLKKANARLQSQITRMDKEYQTQTQEFNAKIWQHNRSLVFMNAVRGVLEDLTKEDTPEAQKIRESFVEKYKEQVSNSLQKGFIHTSPERDQEFQQALPRTRQFIMDMLDSVAKKNTNSHPQELDHDDPGI